MTLAQTSATGGAAGQERGVALVGLVVVLQERPGVDLIAPVLAVEPSPRICRVDLVVAGQGTCGDAQLCSSDDAERSAERPLRDSSTGPVAVAKGAEASVLPGRHVVPWDE